MNIFCMINLLFENNNLLLKLKISKLRYEIFSSFDLDIWLLKLGLIPCSSLRYFLFVSNLRSGKLASFLEKLGFCFSGPKILWILWFWIQRIFDSLGLKNTPRLAVIGILYCLNNLIKILYFWIFAFSLFPLFLFSCEKMTRFLNIINLDIIL